MNTKQIIILEGPDGGGKSFAAQQLLRTTGARYVHCGAFRHVKKNLARFYVDAMLPALLGYDTVILDRCWLSEVPYGFGFRHGAVRLTVSDRRMLERLALAGGAKVILCLPPWENVLATWQSRKGEEYLKTRDQLAEVYHQYENLRTDLAVTVYDYTQSAEGVVTVPNPGRFDHVVPWAAGLAEAQTVLVGESFGEPREHDSFWQWPFVSFSSTGCSRWLTQCLEAWGVPERELAWINADQLDEVGARWLRFGAGGDRVSNPMNHPRRVVALGAKAHRTLDRFKVPHHTVPHPQAWKRFHVGEVYPLHDVLTKGRAVA